MHKGRVFEAATGGARLAAGLVACLVAWGIGAGIGRADFYFYGVAEDQFLLDNDMLWDAMNDWPEWATGVGDLKDNRYGKIVGGARDSIYEDLMWYADQVGDGDVFVFAYAGHGGWTASDGNGDEGSTSRPPSNHPAPSNSPPYAGDEFFGKNDSSGTKWMYDDDFLAALSDFDPGAEVIVISGACHSGGWIGGTSDLDHSAPAIHHGLFAMFGAPEQGLGIALGPVGNTSYYSILFLQALAATVDAGLTAEEWFNAAVEYGAHKQSYVRTDWGTGWYYWWPEPDWQPTEDDLVYYSDPAHWGWQETYLQLTPVAYGTLDADHDNVLFTPEPGSLGAVSLGLIVVVMRRRVKLV